MTQQDPWTSFWREAQPHGCTTGFPPAAQALLADRWRQLFAAAPRPVLDIACGRGALWHHAGTPTHDWLGIDLATIIAAPFPFQSGLDAAALPFPDKAFALVVSQFGLEYAGLPAAIAEAARVCNARLVALVHATEGAPCEQAREQLAQIDWLEAQALAPRLHRHFSNATETTAADIDALLAAIVARADEDANNSLLEAVWRGTMATQQDPHGPTSAVDALAAGLAGHRVRLAAMLAAAPDAAATQAAADQLHTSGFSARIEDASLAADTGTLLIGRWLIADRIK
ncbi:hypothetical protein GCM10007973_24890 [Polymorphobacter multimanifer]|uniref:SAM-dependent methyltransferase n=1 Tax=Polymorphobacter multimanifer TaxID=1070431 RepID=A0A841LI25_9SPHN|nr:class I SAM-dependent methyltransferase [Polymorphobacter multimanifer]MBB6228852.1 SAM-dependent methyltransferase [Polymorphobacter multimanifer]GGI87436.1 hypothetical protein GCM10007973_24890 [Polymorphobacter multimanifer]